MDCAIWGLCFFERVREFEVCELQMDATLGNGSGFDARWDVRQRIFFASSKLQTFNVYGLPFR